MNIRSFLKSRKALFFLSLLLVLFVVFALVFAIFSINRQTRIISNPTKVAISFPANIDYEPRGYGTYNPNALQNPTMAGVDVNMNWSQVEPQQGMFNWAPADNEIAAWVARGKKFTLIVRYANESGITRGTNCNVPQFFPSWEITRIPDFCDLDRRTFIPDYFDPAFKADLKAYVAAIAQHFADSSFSKNLLYVRVGLGLAGEGFPLMPCVGRCQQSDFQVDKSKLVAFGYSPLAWKAWQEEMLTYFKSVFPHTIIIYPINQLDIDPTTGQPVQMEVAYWAAANEMGIGQQGLVPGFPNNYAQIKTILSYIQSHYPGTYIQFQTVAAVSGASELQGDINTANQYGARSIEWYANDAANPSYQSLFQQWQQMVDSRFGGNGGG